MIQALIFDFDGLILDTETPEFRVWQDIYREHGFELPAEKGASIVGGNGHSDFDAAKHLSILTQGRLDSISLRDRNRLESSELIHSQGPMPGVMDYIHEAQGRGLGLAIASSSDRAWVHRHAARLGPSRTSGRPSPAASACSTGSSRTDGTYSAACRRGSGRPTSPT